MKKICILKGSPRKQGNTNALVEPMLKVFHEAGCDVKTFDLYDMNIKPCLACRACQKDWTKVECAQNDDFLQIANVIMDSDVILVASPIYSWYCTPPTKALMDRLVYAMNMLYGEEMGPSLWGGKSLALVSSCGYKPEKGADLWEEGMKRYSKHSQLKYVGMLCERHKGYKYEFMDEEKEAHAIEFAKKIVSEEIL